MKQQEVGGSEPTAKAKEAVSRGMGQGEVAGSWEQSPHGSGKGAVVEGLAGRILSQQQRLPGPHLERFGEPGLTWCSRGLVADGDEEDGEGSHRDLHVRWEWWQELESASGARRSLFSVMLRHSATAQFIGCVALGSCLRRTVEFPPEKELIAARSHDGTMRWPQPPQWHRI